MQNESAVSSVAQLNVQLTTFVKQISWSHCQTCIYFLIDNLDTKSKWYQILTSHAPLHLILHFTHNLTSSFMHVNILKSELVFILFSLTRAGDVEFIFVIFISIKKYNILSIASENFSLFTAVWEIICWLKRILDSLIIDKILVIRRRFL